MKNAFDKIIFEKYERIVEKCKERIYSTSTSSFTAWKYCQKYLSFNYSLFFCILLESLEDNNLLLMKISEIVRHAFQNYNHNDAILDLKKSLFNYRIDHDSPSIIHILMFQLLYSTNVFSSNEIIILVQIFQKMIQTN